MIRAPTGRIIGHEFIVSDEPQFAPDCAVTCKKCP
jgi:hypothetical protein